MICCSVLLRFVTNIFVICRVEFRLILLDARFRHSLRWDGSKENDFTVSIPAILDWISRRFDASVDAPFSWIARSRHLPNSATPPIAQVKAITNRPSRTLYANRIGRNTITPVASKTVLRTCRDKKFFTAGGDWSTDSKSRRRLPRPSPSGQRRGRRLPRRGSAQWASARSCPA